MAKVTWPRFTNAKQAAVYRQGIRADIDRLEVRVENTLVTDDKRESLQLQLAHEVERLKHFDAWLTTCKLFAQTS